MSLVERALKKLQEDRSAGSAAPKSAVAERASNPVAVVPRHAVTSAATVMDVEPDRPDSPRRKVFIDRAALRDIGVLPMAGRERLIADQYRHIKRRLLDNIAGRGETKIEHARLIMMTSALSGDGKTFTSVNLALSLANEKDRTCLLIDSDVPKPHIGRLLGVQDEPGLLDALRDPSLDVESLILPTDVAGLSILPAGQPHEGDAELLGSERMRQILDRLEARDPRRVALFDTPPVLLSTESRILVNVAGQIVFVVRAGITPRGAVLEALTLIDERVFVGLILNQSEADPVGGYYGYGYGYDVDNKSNKK
jgi:protein-tyrosine kinase